MAHPFYSQFTTHSSLSNALQWIRIPNVLPRCYITGGYCKKLKHHSPGGFQLEIPQPSPPPCGSKAQSVIASACWQPLHRRYTITRHPSPVTHHLLLITRYSLRVTEYLRGRYDIVIRHPPHSRRAAQGHRTGSIYYCFSHFYLCPIHSAANLWISFHYFITQK